MEQQQSQEATPTPETTDDRAKAHAEQAERKRNVRSLELQRERILSERTSNPNRRSALEYALADIEEKLAELGWSVHL